MNIICFLSEIPPYTKHDIDVGATPPLVYALAEACRNSFFLSHAIRTDVNFAIAIYPAKILIVYYGQRIRYLGPDERSQAFLLRKALDISQNMTSNQVKMSTPGLYVRRGEWELMLPELLGKKIVWFKAGAAAINNAEILSPDSFLFNVDSKNPPNLSELGGQGLMVERDLPPPYNTASLGTQILYLHHVRDLS